MKKTKTLRIATILIFFSFLAQISSPIFACGPSFLEPVFVMKSRPDFPREDFINGDLGIIGSDYAQKNLFVAYRILNNSPFSAKEREDLHRLWNVDNIKTTQPDADYDKNRAAVIKWITIRNQVTTELPPNYAPLDKKSYEFYQYRDLEKQYKGYVFFKNCTANALEVAADTLKNRADSYGVKDPNVIEWLHGQDVVFSNCSKGENMPAGAAQTAPQWLKNDREYQTAAALFYAGKFDDAAKKFDGIASDSSSVWHELSDYLVGRTLLRQASFADNEADSKKYLESAEQRFERIYRGTGKHRLDARELLNLVEIRLHPEKRIHELNHSLLAPNAENDLRQNLIDYTWLLAGFNRDSLLEVEKTMPQPKAEPTPDESKSLKEAAITPSPRNNSDTNSMLPASNANSSRSANTSLTNTTIPAAQEPANDVEKTNKYNDDSYPYYEGSLLLKQKYVPQFLQADDLSDWILNYQLDDEDSLKHAVERYHQTKKEHWLMSAMSKLKSDSAQTNEFLTIAQNIPHNSKAFPTVSYNVIRLLLEQQKFAEARQKLDSIFADKSLNLPISAQNQFFSQRMILAENLSDFLKFAQRRAAIFEWDGDGGYETLTDKPNGKDYIVDERPWKSRTMFDIDAQQVFERQMPLSILKQAATSPQLPDHLKRQLLITIWCRAVLLEDEATARDIAPALAKYAPETQLPLKQYLNSSSPKDRQNSALFVLLNFPGFSPIFTQGMGRLTSIGKIDSYRNNWWCQYDKDYYNGGEESSDDKKPLFVPKISFLSDSEIAAAKQEHEKVALVQAAPYYLIPRVLEWADGSPNDGRLPEALHLAVKTSRYGCADDKIAELSKAAFTVLHRRYPGSIWAKKTPYWFSN